MTKKIGIFSFFAGAGFLDLGFEKTDKYKTLFVNEIHQPFMDIYRYARKFMNIETPEYGYSVSDISEFLKKEKLTKLKDEVEQARNENDIVGFIGGPPCPDFSVGGKNKGKDGENGRLSKTYADLICRAKPDFFLFENVKGLYRTEKHRIFFDSLKVQFKRSGYVLTENLINAIEFGAPQDRERIILIGFKRSFLQARNKKYRRAKELDFNWKSNILYNSEEIFSKNWATQTEYREDSVIEHPDNIIPELTVEYWFQQNNISEHPNKNMYFTPKEGLAKFQTIAEGDDKKKSYKRLHRWRYSPTAAYGNNEVHLHPYKSRRLSVPEALAIQSLPKEFIIPIDMTLSNAFKAIGNGVPYLAAKGLAFNIFNFISKLKSDAKTNSK